MPATSSTDFFWWNANVSARHLELHHLTQPDGSCVRLNSAGVPYEELACLYPWLKRAAFITNWEQTVDIFGIRDWMRETLWWYPALCVGLYLGMVFFLPRFFVKRFPLNLRGTWAAWNFALSVFSAIGFVRTFPALVHYAWTNQSYTDWYCVDPETTCGSGSTGLWALLWVLSKVPEFLDTFFLIVHKRPVIFLHWFHHAITFLGSHVGYTMNYNGLVYCTVNYGVHAVMYFYYGCCLIKCCPSWLNPFYITLAQILQMAVALIFIFTGVYVSLVLQPPGCGQSAMLSPQWLVFTSCTFFCFFVLFAKIFFQRYKVSATTSSSSSVTWKNSKKEA